MSDASRYQIAMKPFTASFLVLIALLSSPVFAAESRCHLEFSTYTANVFGKYSVKKKLWEENYRSNSEDCYAHVHELLKRYTNISTRWSHVDLSFEGGSGESSSKASFTKH